MAAQPTLQGAISSGVDLLAAFASDGPDTGSPALSWAPDTVAAMVVPPGGAEPVRGALAARSPGAVAGTAMRAIATGADGQSFRPTMFASARRALERVATDDQVAAATLADPYLLQRFADDVGERFEAMTRHAQGSAAGRPGLALDHALSGFIRCTLDGDELPAKAAKRIRSIVSYVADGARTRLAVYLEPANAPRELWALWLPGEGRTLRGAVALALATWWGGWRAKASDGLDRSTPAIARKLLDWHLAPVLTRAPTVEPDRNGSGAVVWTADRQRIGEFPTLDARIVATLADAQRGLDLLRSPGGLRLIYFAVAAAVARRAAALGEREDTRPQLVVEFPGGLVAFARSIGIDAPRLRAILDAGTGYYTDTIRGLWTWTPGGRGRAPRARMTWNDGVFDGDHMRGLRVPMPDHRRRLPVINRNLQGACEVAWLLAHGDLADRSVELSRQGAAPLDWWTIADVAGLPRRTAPKLLDALLDGDDEGPFLLQPEPGRYRLADPRAHRYLVSQGRRRLRGSAAAREGARKRKDRIARAAKRADARGNGTRA